MEPLNLSEEQRELVQAEVKAMLPSLSEKRRQDYLALSAALGSGEVPGDLVPLLEGVVTLSLETGRARRIYRAEGERLLTDLFLQTPRGKEVSQRLAEVNRALVALQGHPLSSVQVAMRTLGQFTIRIGTSAASVTLLVWPQGVAVESVSVGGDEAGPG